MAKTGYKLQEFVAHSGNVNCLKIGRKASRLFITGGDDHNVNLWMIGKATSLMSLCGHSTTVESVTFDSAEILVLSGASSGVIKLWDLQEAKMLRTLTGHRTNCTAVEFHPFGEFFASGSSDTNLNIWDIRKKGCIHTYKGHSQAISTIKFSPDGRWVVSGGFDNVVKVWDLTGGKLLHDFKFHEGHIRSLDFHPLEFLLATGSADRTVKFWDLETFELIGSSRHEVSGVCSLTFHPDGWTLFAGLEDSLKVYSWEPVICHDAVDMGWTTLGDLCIHDEKLLGCSFYSNSVGVWVSDISLIKPYGDGLETENKESTEQKLSLQGRQMEKVEYGVDNESKEIKNIYIDSSEGNPDHLLRSRSYNSPKMDHLEESKEMLNLSSATRVRAKSNEQTLRKSYIVSNVAPLDILNDIDFREFVDTIRNSDSATNPNFEMNEVRDSIDDKHPIESVAEKFEKTLTPDGFSEQEKCNQSSSYSNAINPVKYANGVAVVQGRTRSLVKRFERKEITPTKEDQDNATPTTTVENREIFLKEDQTNASPITTTSTSEKGEIIPFSEDKNNMPTVPNTTSETDKHMNFMKAEFGRDSNPANDGEIIEYLLQTHDVTLSNLRSRLTKLQVVRHFWERNDTKGAINALEKLPDQSVQADVISVLVVKMEILTLDLFSCLLPVLTGLLDSKTERHVKVSLDMLLKLVVVFGPTIRSTISAPPSVGVDLHAEQRRECSNQCFMQLQKIRMILPILVRRGGVLAKTAQELNLILQQP
ncbi:katanin p80 WD40 repeat-containing subunit B1 homolog KTN80.2-like isoform X1 [Vigna umbellata]|uniref:katanin p80 WD40 repeat-containing subunit B1 homolog KTN80.2-like isoform X1 n=1 Tax=Vigna umbellata TaxID=87088 RepID=UPI001F5EB9A5|nr:katanin p80 WD40 repeat-containing subunit B1 homolog KTN80.2-like isoform X1 [Vigna umbellata]XP_047147904.1 katanin p80 WD40 repeat-containing subunit B1 homolog KTN80.2-like isoform X1 [Vigna umbellata]